MAEVSLEFLAVQIGRVLDQVNALRDDQRVTQARFARIELMLKQQEDYWRVWIAEISSKFITYQSVRY